MNIQIYIIYLCALFLGYFLTNFTKERMTYALIFVFSLIGLSLAVFSPAEIITGTQTILVSPTETISEFISTENLLLNGVFIFVFIMSAFMSLMLWMEFENRQKN